jgi:hypothetical protein
VARARNAVTGGLLVLSENVRTAAFGVFFRFQVTDFEVLLGFFFLCHFIVPILFVWVVCSLGCVNGTEEHLMPSHNVLFWNQGAEANQFIPAAFAPFTD